MTRLLALLCGIAASLLATPAPAQPSPHAGMEHGPLKALPADQVEDLLQGRGAGFALAAELNGYPGPAHVLEHTAALGLDPARLAATRALHARMAAAARALGAGVVEEERALDAAFADRSIDAATLADRLRRIAALQGELRGVHLGAHLEQTALLAPAQIAAYGRLRGYAGGGGGQHAPASGGAAGGPHGHGPGMHPPATR